MHWLLDGVQENLENQGKVRQEIGQGNLTETIAYNQDSTQKLKADLASLTIRRFFIHYFEL